MIITFFSHPVEIRAPLLTTTCGAVQVHPKVAALTRQRVRKSAFQVLGPAVVVVTMVVGIAIGLSSEPGGRPFNALDVVVATIAVLSCPVSGAAPPSPPPIIPDLNRAHEQSKSPPSMLKTALSNLERAWIV